ncbi:hypothetical protein FB451DRAFT_1509134 [Mycena latifolia]|nr:hypothetical protein FB451DRAFT_1509134 [Mycena latifolia]
MTQYNASNCRGTDLFPSGLSPSLVPSQASQAPQPSHRDFPVVALGGTFDHLHTGYKILLNMAAWIASEKLIVGVTGVPSTSALAPTHAPHRRRAPDAPVARRI